MNLKWVEIGKNKLQVSAEIHPEEFTFLNETHIDPIQLWCQEHKCGTRTSFDTFKFKNKKEMVMFLLRWG